MPIIDDFVMENLIYCEKTHSFVHRLYDKWQKKGLPKDKNMAQSDAWDIIKEMNEVAKNGGFEYKSRERSLR